MGKYVYMTVNVPVSQYVKVEAAAKEGSRSLKSTASFLLSKWVLSTRKGRGAKCRANRTNRSGKDGPQ